MSVPFSNTHLRVPRGFGTILERLAREILRDQPDDIPTYAAHYFNVLLTQREDSGMDPAEWAAKLEDRFYNNHAFKGSQEKELTISKEKSYESQTEDEASHSAEVSILSTKQPNVSEELDVTESTEEEEEKNNITEKHVDSVENDLSKEDLISRVPVTDVQSDERTGTDEEKDPTITTLDQDDGAANEKDNTVPERDIPSSELEPSSFGGISNVDVCAQELVPTEDERGEILHEENILVDDNETEDSEGEESTKVDEPEEVFPYSGLANVNVCATELGEIEKTMEQASVDDEGTVVQSSLSQSETLEDNQHEAEHHSDKTKEKGGTETEVSSGEMNETLDYMEGNLDSSAIPKEDSLVEISFEDVPEAQQNIEVEEKQPVEEVLHAEISEMWKHEEFTEDAAVVRDENISGAQNFDEPEIEYTLKVVNTGKEEIESQQEASNMKEKVGANDTDLNDSNDDDDDDDDDGDDDGDDEKGDGVKNISSHQPTTEADEESPENETNYEIKDDERISGGEFDQNEDSKKQTESNDPDVKEDKTADAAGEDTEGHSEMKDTEINDGNAENKSSQVTQPNISKAGIEAESETLQASAQQHLPEENEERTLVESQPEDTGEGKEVMSEEATSEAEELVEEGKNDSEAQERSDAMCISPTQSADQEAADHQGEQRPHMSETAEPEGQRSDKEECSRPQEEEDIMDIPLDDPEANRAAAKIQAGFRGHMTRKKMKPEDKAEGEEVSSTGDVLNGSQGDTETGGSGAVEGDDTSVPEQ